MNKTRIANWAIVVTCVAIVLLPLIATHLRTEIANWHLAAAANALELGVGDYEESIRRASSSGVELKSIYNYWLLEMEQTLEEKPNRVGAVIQEAKEAGVDYQLLGLHAVRALQLKNDQANAVAVFEATLTEKQRQEPAALNQLAYMRSLSGLELDKALEDINLAIESLEEGPYRNQRESAYRDTKAWVLFQMGRLPEAAEEANIAVEKLTEAATGNGLDFLNSVLVWLNRQMDSQANRELQDGEFLTEYEAGIDLWNEGVIRYHRARILEGLGRDEQAQVDYDWLAEHHLPADDRLH